VSAGRLLTARQIAERLLVSTETVLRWVRRGEFEGVVVWLPGGAIRFREDRFEEWLELRAAAERGSVSHPAGRRPAATLMPVSHPPSEEDQ
jgi:excisionase family DNA binding protein